MVFTSQHINDVMRLMPANRVACPVTLWKLTSRKPRPATEKKGCIVELLQKAVEWRRQLDVGEVADQQAIPRGEGISRARGTQIMGCCG